MDAFVEPIKREHLPARVEWINNPAVSAGLIIDTPITLDSTQRWFEAINGDERRLDFCMVDRTGGHNRPIGMGGLVDIDYKNKNVCKYIFVDPSITGKGIGEALVQWICNYAFSKLHLNKVYLYTQTDNIPAMRLYGKVGFQLEGTLREHTFHNGAFIDRHIMGIVHQEWLKKPWKNEDLVGEVKI